MYSVSSQSLLHTNMAPRGMITVTAALLCTILVPATCFKNSKMCCTTYSRKPVPFQEIRGFRQQSVTEYCHIEAIIFYMANKSEVCATQRDAWVRKALALLSYRLRKMSKVGSAAAETKKRRGNPSLDNGNGYFLSTMATFLNNTESFN